jgi:excinuclease ABC subunit C
MNKYIMDKLSLVPFEPGCYLMKDKQDTIIYVGKAKRLRNRLRSYFTGSHNIKTTKLVSEIVDFEFIVTSSELEALILELNLIKQYDPKYNILLKDDKTYPYIQLTNEVHPRLIITRNIKESKGEYFGPYPNVSSARETKYLLDKMFPLRKCHPLENKFCLYYHIKQCLGPCEKKIDTKVYEEYKDQIRKILKGNTDEIIKELTDKMEEYSMNLQFEKAKEYKDLIDHLNKTVQKQKIILSDFNDRDIFGYYYKNGFLSIQVFYMRGGKLIERDTHITPYYADPKEEFPNFIIQFYQNGNNIKPKEIFIPNDIETDLLEEYLNIKVVTPKIGDKAKLVELACQNAEITLENKIRLLLQNDAKTLGALEELSELIGVEELRRIEAFDNSHISGSEAISGMVVYVDGKPSKKDYRKYKIKFANTADDYDYMREVIYRRYFRVLKDDLTWPDLIVIDGGKGQVNICKAILHDLNMPIKVIGLVKDDKHKTSELLDGDTMAFIPIKKQSKAFHLLMGIQEEVHRYAITFHRSLRNKKLTQSFLDDIEGVGPKRKKQLLNHFGSIKKIKEASVEELQEAGIPYNVSVKIKEKVLNSN